MTIFILILAAIFLIGLGFGATVWFILRHREQVRRQNEAVSKTLPFRWGYIMAPIAILVLSVVLSALFYSQLAAEVGYHFRSDGTPDRWLSREMAMVLMLAPQLFLVFIAWGITWGINRLGILSQPSQRLGIKPQRILLLTGNIAALPQLVLSFTMLDIFIYNSYKIHLMPTWLFLLILGLSTIALGVLLILIIWKAKGRLFY